MSNIVQCKHNRKIFKDGVCADCAIAKPLYVFRSCKDECFVCNECGYFWGPGSPLNGQRAIFGVYK